MVTVTNVHMMNVEQTANWVRTYGAHRGWQEATVYAMSFRKNSIYGRMLKHLNHEILKFELDMSNGIHRLEMLAIIRQLFPSNNHCKVVSEPTTLSGLRERDTNWDHRQKAVSASPISEPSKPVEDIPWMVRCLVPDRYESLGMDLSSVQNKSTNLSSVQNKRTIGTSSDSEMEVSESKFSHTTIRKSFSVRINLQQTQYTA